MCRPVEFPSHERAAMLIADLILTDIQELLTLDPELCSDDNPLGIIRDAAVAIGGGRILWVGPTAQLPAEIENHATERMEVETPVVLPGLVDCHTHLVFAGNRADEFARKIAGEDYMKIAREGGGILATMRAVREASLEELMRNGAVQLRRGLAFGVTTMEIKSGYGLETEAELKQLQAIKELGAIQPVETVPTFMGAHEFPPEYRDRRDAFVDLVIDEMLPAVAEQGIARFCDVFCEQGVFDIEQSRRILERAKELDLIPRLHADEFVDTGGGALAAELGASSADHLMACNPESRARMREAGVVAVALPGVSFFLNKNWLDARVLLDEGLTVAIATDFNPGSSMSQNLWLMAQMGCCRMGMTVPEAIRAVTYNAAKALRMEDRIGSISKGKQADLIGASVAGYAELIYHFGVNHIDWAIKRGGMVWRA